QQQQSIDNGDDYDEPVEEEDEVRSRMEIENSSKADQHYNHSKQEEGDDENEGVLEDDVHSRAGDFPAANEQQERR
ncbi:unnamed protein product, partial [Didymodactylos carnosus]